MGILRFRGGKKANREEITQETWISVLIPILKEPSWGPNRRACPRLHSVRRSQRLRPFPPEPKQGWGAGLERSEGTRRVSGRRATPHTTGKDWSDRETYGPAPARVPNTPAEADLPPGSANNQQRPGRRLKGASPDFRRTRDVNMRRYRWPAGLPAEVLAGGCGGGAVCGGLLSLRCL